MSDFKAKMYQIRFPLGLRPSAPDRAGGAYSAPPEELTALPQRSVGAYNVPPDLLAIFKWPNSKGRRRKGVPLFWTTLYVNKIIYTFHKKSKYLLVVKDFVMIMLTTMIQAAHKQLVLEVG